MSLKHRISEKIVLDREINWLFDFTQDFRERKKWDKQTAEIGFIDGHRKLKKGAKVYTRSKEGVRMDTEYLTFNSPHEISIRMLNKSSIFKDFIGSWNYLRNEDDKTTLVITYRYNLRFPYSLIPNKVSQKIRTNILKKLGYLESYLIEIENLSFGQKTK